MKTVVREITKRQGIKMKIFFPSKKLPADAHG